MMQKKQVVEKKSDCKNKDKKDSTETAFTIGFVGLGLMGGSFAKAIQKALPSHRLLAYDKNPDTLEKAKKQGLIAEGFSSQPELMLIHCDLVYINLYPGMVADFIIEHEKDFKSAAIISDISGVKTKIAEKLSCLSRKDIAIVLGHPMAGSEKEGFDHANESIFLGRNYIFIEDVPYAEANPALHKKATEQLKELALAIGFSRTIETNAKVHDHKIAFTSQLCHVIASALVQSAEDTEITAFGGGSYEDLTRIAMINAPLWTELFLSNNTELVKHIEIFEKYLDNLKNLISEKNKESLEKNLHEVRKKRIAMNGKK